MYDTTYKCRYNLDSVFLDSDEVNDDQKDYIRDILYKEDLIHIFNTESYEVFDCFIGNLHDKLINHEKMKECMKIAAKTLVSENTELGLCILYSYDYMYLTHICVSEYLDTGLISDENIDELYEKLNQSI